MPVDGNADRLRSRRRAAARAPRSRITGLWSAALALAGICSALDAQAPDTAQPPVAVAGMRVRLWEQAARDLSMPVVGNLASIRPDSVDIRPDGSETAIAVPRAAVTRVETSLGPHSASRSSAAWMGAAVGGLGGAILGVIAGNISRHNAAKLGIGGALVGAGGGAAIGANWPGEAWRRATLPPAASTP